MSVKLVTDSTSYLPKEYLKEYDISLVSLNVLLNNKSLREVDISNEDFYKEMELSKDLPKSSQPGIDELTECFRKIANEGNDIVGVFISSKMSGTYSTAHLVKEIILEEYKDIKIEIIDSTSNCMQMGFQVLQGARAARNGKNISEVTEVINNVIDRSKFIFTPDNLRYLKKGGRIGGASALFGSILKINPILTVENGETTVLDKVRTKKRAVEAIVNKVMADAKEKGIEEIIVHHINCIDEGLTLASLLSNKLNLEVKIQPIGPIIGLHVGPLSIGVAYYTKK